MKTLHVHSWRIIYILNSASLNHLCSQLKGNIHSQLRKLFEEYIFQFEEESISTISSKRARLKNQYSQLKKRVSLNNHYSEFQATLRNLYEHNWSRIYIYTIEQDWRIYKFTIEKFSIFTIGVEFTFTIWQVLGIYIHNWGSWTIFTI